MIEYTVVSARADPVSLDRMSPSSIPVVILTGFLGAGKTTILRSLLSQLPPTSRPVWLKNEFGDSAIDSRLASGAVAVREIVNGCLCCQLVGQMSEALLELISIQPRPDYIFIETSGSAYPAPVAREILRLQEQKVPVRIASILCVVDCENFPGYKDTSYTAKLQARYTDLILLNKHEAVSENALDTVIDQVVDLNPDTARLKTDRGNVDINLVLEVAHNDAMFTGKFTDLIETEHHSAEVDVLIMEKNRQSPFSRNSFETFLTSLSKDTFYRVKGFVWMDDGLHMVNFAFGRFEFKQVDQSISDYSSKLTLMGVGIRYRIAFLKHALELADAELKVLQ